MGDLGPIRIAGPGGKPPTRQQQEFIKLSCKYQLYGGAKRGGKTVALCMKAVLLSVAFPGNRGMISRKDWPDLRDSTMATFWDVVPRELISNHNQTDHIITFINGSQILYRGLSTEKDIEKVKGINLGWFAIDEPSEIAQNTFLMLAAQLTWVLPNGGRPVYMAMAASNPEPGWVESFFPTPESSKPVEGSAFIPSLPRDNPHLPPGWEDELRCNFPGDWVEKYLDGSWRVTEGTVFQELDPVVHDIPPFDWSSLNLQAAIDHATTGVSAMVLTGMDPDDNLIALHEYFESNRLIQHHSFEMLKLQAMYSARVRSRSLDYCLIDPSTVARTLQGHNSLESVQDRYRECGIDTILAWNALEAGIDRIKERLHVRPDHVNPFNLRCPSPSLFIVRRNCPNLWSEMRSLKKKLKANGGVEFVGEDHALDCLRYICNSKPQRAIPRQPVDHRPLQDRFAANSHDRWLRKWAKQSGEVTNTWF